MSKVRIRVQNQEIRSETRVDEVQVEVLSEIGNKPLGRRAKKAHNGPNTYSS